MTCKHCVYGLPSPQNFRRWKKWRRLGREPRHPRYRYSYRSSRKYPWRTCIMGQRFGLQRQVQYCDWYMDLAKAQEDCYLEEVEAGRVPGVSGG